MRISGGRLSGQKLAAPRGTVTRPTAARARKSLFGLLGDLTGQSVLDLYAGSGSLGIEALSRGAVRAVFVESRPEALSVLWRNLSNLGLSNCSLVLRIPVERAGRLLLSLGPFDLVLCDPPWARIQRALSTLERIDWRTILHPQGRLVLEHPSRIAVVWPPGTGLSHHVTRAWGDTAVTILEPVPGAGGEDVAGQTV